MAGQMTVSGLSAGLNTGQKIIGPSTIVGASIVGAITDITLAAGDNTVAVPVGAIAVWIVPPAANTQTLKVRTNANSTDAGLPVAPGDPFGPWSFRGQGVMSIIINSTGTVTVELSFI